MKLLTAAFAIVLLSTTASANPIGWRQHQDADIADNDLMQGWLEGNTRWSTESSSYEDSSSESNQSPESSESAESAESSESNESSESSESAESSESSEEVLITEQTTTVMTTAAMKTTTMVDESTPTAEPGTMSTDEPTVTEKTASPATPTTPHGATSPGCVIHCFTEEIPTEAPITERRGDN